MLAATQLGLVPPEVKSPQDEARALANFASESWPPTKREYKSEDVRRIATSLNQSIGTLIDTIVNALNDSMVSERTDITSQAASDLSELQRFQRALAIPVEQSRKGATVDLPEFRSAIPAMMKRVVQIWVGMSPIHDVFIGWIDGDQADRITQGFRDVLEVVKSMPGARSIGFLSRHKTKIALGAVAAVVTVVSGGAAWWLILRGRTGTIDPEQLPEGDDAQVPVGVFDFSHEDEIPSVADRTVLTQSGDQILISGDVDNKTKMSQIADILAKMP